MRSSSLRLVCLAALPVALLACNRVGLAPAARGGEVPSVLLVTIDTLRADHVGAYGAKDVSTPHLDRLAGEGVRFEQAIAPTPITLPSHASLMTGQYPPRHGVRHNGVYVLGTRHPTLAERFAAAGHRTGAVVGAIVLAEHFGLARGFSHYDDRIAGGGSSLSGFPERRASDVTDRALAWLEQGEGPYFLWVHYYDPHAHYAAPEPHASRFADRPYDGEIAYVDAELGRLLEAVERRDDDTLVAVTSDHGEGLGEHGEKTHSILLYDSVLRVPLLVRGPGVAAGKVIEDVVSLVDVAPTLLGLSGLDPLPDVEGQDLSKRLLTGAAPDAGGAARGWAYAESLVAHMTMGWSPLQAIRDRTHHYVHSPNPELFVLDADPQQLEDRLGSGSEGGDQDETLEPIVSRARARLASVLHAGAGEQDLPGATARTPLDAQTRAQIESLGYALPIPGDRPGEGAEDFDPKDGLRWIEKAMAAHDAQFAGRLDLAEAWALEVVERFPESRRAHEILTQVYLRTHRYAEARVHAEALARLAPEWAEHHARVGLARLRTDDLPGAVEAFAAALARDPEHVGAHLGMMLELQLGGSDEQALAHARFVLQRSGREIEYEQVGASWQAGGHPERALETWREGLRRHPSSQRLRARLEDEGSRG